MYWNINIKNKKRFEVHSKILSSIISTIDDVNLMSNFY